VACNQKYSFKIVKSISN